MSIKSEALNDLFDAFPGKQSDRKANLYRGWADKTDVEIVERVVTFCIGEDNSLPKLSRLYTLSRDYAMQNAQNIPEEECWFCDSTGLIPGIYKGSRGDWTHGIISACKCTNGMRKTSVTIERLLFEHDVRYLDLMKVLKKNKKKAHSPWGAVPFFYQELRGAGLLQTNKAETNLHEKIESIIDA